jgi:hypothetical protein
VGTMRARLSRQILTVTNLILSEVHYEVTRVAFRSVVAGFVQRFALAAND